MIPQSTISDRFAPLATPANQDDNLNPMVAYFNKKATDTVAGLSGKKCRKRKPWVSPEKLDLSDQRKELKTPRGEPEGTKDCSNKNTRVEKRLE